MVNTLKIKSLYLLPVAFFLWYFTFNTDLNSFWFRLTLSSLILALLSVLSGGERNFKPNIYEGVLIVWVSILLYILFWVLDFIAGFSSMLREEIESVYKLASGVNPVLLALLLVVIAVCEELFWRGFVSEALLRKLDIIPAVLAASAFYSLVHIFTLNLSLVLAAFILGIIMNLLYVVTGKVSTTIYVHAIWSVLVFVVLPLA